MQVPPKTQRPRQTPAPEAKAVNNEAAYIAAGAGEEKELTAAFARGTTELLRREEFAPRGFRLDTLRPPPILPVTAVAIGLRYGRIPLKAKTKFHADQIKVEVARIRVLVQQGFQRIKAMESEITYVESLEAEREDQVRILQGSKNNNRSFVGKLGLAKTPSSSLYKCRTIAMLRKSGHPEKCPLW